MTKQGSAPKSETSTAQANDWRSSEASIKVAVDMCSERLRAVGSINEALVEVSSECGRRQGEHFKDALSDLTALVELCSNPSDPNALRDGVTEFANAMVHRSLEQQRLGVELSFGLIRAALVAAKPGEAEQ
ncbi:hypothetical protein ACWCOP_07970 [Maricaulaceae bacterium MS644]